MDNMTDKNYTKHNKRKYLDLTSYFISCVNKRLFYLISPILITIMLNLWIDSKMDMGYFLCIISIYLVIMIVLAICGYKHKKKNKQLILRHVSLFEKLKTFGIMFMLTFIELIIIGYIQVILAIK